LKDATKSIVNRASDKKLIIRTVIELVI
jgi:hypothetical protein